MDDERGIQSLYTLPEYYMDIVGPSTDTGTEVEFLDQVFQEHGVTSVLDVACGVGRHAVPLAERGYSVTGIDLSSDLLARARERAREAEVDCRFLEKNANSFETEQRFDAAICMWSTLGEGPMQYPRVIRNVYDALAQDGIFVIDNSSWERLPDDRERSKSYSVTASDGAVIDTDIHDRFTRRFRIREVETVIKREDGVETYNDVCITHLLREDDWKRELQEAGFESFTVYHDFSEERKDAPERVQIVASKEG